MALLRRGDGDRERSERTLAAVERNVNHLVELTHKLEAVARIQTPADSAVVQEVSATTVVQEATRQLREMADAHAVQVQIGDDLPVLTVDVGRLELVFVNLISNAVKYSDPNKPVRVVEVRGSLTSCDECRFEVRDNGLGIPEHALSAIFQRFTRAHHHREELQHIAGIGLGLSIVEDCVRACSGRRRRHRVFVVTLPKMPGRS